MFASFALKIRLSNEANQLLVCQGAIASFVCTPQH